MKPLWKVVQIVGLRKTNRTTRWLILSAVFLGRTVGNMFVSVQWSESQSDEISNLCGLTSITTLSQGSQVSMQGSKCQSGEKLRVILACMCVKPQIRFFVCHRVGPFWVHSGSILGPFWVHLGSILVMYLQCFNQYSDKNQCLDKNAL